MFFRGVLSEFFERISLCTYTNKSLNQKRKERERQRKRKIERENLKKIKIKRKREKNIIKDNLIYQMREMVDLL